MDKLKPCPFCGAEASLTKEILGTEYWYFIDISHEDNCILDSQGIHDEFAAKEKCKGKLVKLWNTRK